MKRYLTLILICYSVALNGQLVERFILPQTTDTNINGYNKSHHVYLNAGVPKINKLLLFFPGTNALPSDYTMILKTAANLGYHSIGLCYENLQSINLKVCPTTQDPTCHGRARREVWLGDDTHDSLNITKPNSVLNRFSKLLRYLKTTYPNEGWEQYMVNDSTPNWSLVVTAGHSQGAGNATYGSKLFKLHKVIMFSWVDWMYPGTNPLWITTPGQTPDSAYLGFIHTGDASIFNGIPTTWTNLGVTNYGPIVSVDTSSWPFNQTHGLITSAPIDSLPTQTNYHNATAVDWMTPIDNTSGLPIFKQVWEYLLMKNTIPIYSKAERLSPNGTSYIDPELNSIHNKMTFQTGNGDIWLSDVNPITGRFESPNGLDIKVDSQATSLVFSFNGPEFGIDSTGFALFYNKSSNGIANPIKATISPSGIVNTVTLQSGGLNRISNQPTRDPSKGGIYLFYSKGQSLENGKIVWTTDQPNAPEIEIDSVDVGVRWINQTRKLVYVKQTGPAKGQIALYDATTQSETIITNDTIKKSYCYGWYAPELGKSAILTIIADTMFGIYTQNGGNFYDLIYTISVPNGSLYKYIGSPEPFVSGNRSYISFVTKITPTGSNYVPAQVWVTSIDSNPNTRFSQHCDDGAPNAKRTDPEWYIGTNKVFIYYNLVNSQQKFEVWKYETDIYNSITENQEVSKSLSKNLELIAYPNPASNIVFISEPNNPLTLKTHFKLFRVDGTLIKQGSTENGIWVNDLPNGLYICFCEYNQITYKLKLIKANN